MTHYFSSLKDGDWFRIVREDEDGNERMDRSMYVRAVNGYAVNACDGEMIVINDPLQRVVKYDMPMLCRWLHNLENGNEQTNL